MFAFTARARQRKALKKFRANLRSLLHNDDDIMPEDRKAALRELLAEAGSVDASSGAAAEFLNRGAARMEKLIPRLPFASLRDWLDVLAVALAVAFGIRGLFFQPFKIPTSSMQPTLYGVHYVEDAGVAAHQKFFNRFNALFFAADRAKLIVPEAGFPEYLTPRGSVTEIGFAGKRFRLPGEAARVAEYTALDNRNYARGEVVCDGYVVTGDHLFVERFTPYIFGLKRGDVTVFTTEGINNYDGRPLAQSGYYYIKRLAGMPGDTLKIVNNQLYIRPRGEDNFRHITEFGEAFAKLYSNKGGYQGHANTVGGSFANHLGDAAATFTVPDDSYFMLGDNTRFSSDSRVWGVVPRRNIVGTALWVFWPLSRRWGVADSVEPPDVPTGAPGAGTFASMYKQ